MKIDITVPEEQKFFFSTVFLVAKVNLFTDNFYRTRSIADDESSLKPTFFGVCLQVGRRSY